MRTQLVMPTCTAREEHTAASAQRRDRVCIAGVLGDWEQLQRVRVPRLWQVLPG